ncbi:hypothetical protein [Actinotalea sp. K2]|uniref:hypothetical protein n=1 Tax=Actinotalea sp. K2 TaxID=2939438 RepID=UPI002016F846|nr:hypothetical protein [Actinotalea sp. K2]MCL3862372.1 hypothetical protein [Actinotalea sp. K2]
MKRAGSLVVVGVLLAGLHAAPAHAHGPVSRGLELIGVQECARDINNRGVVVTDTHVYRHGRITSLPDGLSTATRINASGQIGGTTGGVAAVWDGRRTRVIGVADPQDQYSSVTGLSDRGVVVGISGQYGGPSRAFRWQSNALTVLPDLGGDAGALDVNRTGQAVGYAYENGVQVPVRWEADGTLTRLAPLGAGDHALASAINDRGVSVGYAYSAAGSGQMVAVRWSKDGEIEVLTPDGETSGTATDLNRDGAVVGWLTPADGGQQGFVTRGPGQVQGIPALLPDAAGVLNAVNDRGWAVGCEFTSDETHAVLWRP